MKLINFSLKRSLVFPLSKTTSKTLRVFTTKCWMLLALSGCSIIPTLVPKTEGCNIRTYVNRRLTDQVNSQKYLYKPARLAIIPFDVPASFALLGDESSHYGRQIALKFQEELLRSGELKLVELFNRAAWPGKKEDYFSGNYQAIEYARNSGYDFVLVGYMDDIRDSEEVVIFSKAIDVLSHVTVWSAKTVVYTRDRTIGKILGENRITPQRPDLFPFARSATTAAECTVNAIINNDVVPG